MLDSNVGEEWRRAGKTGYQVSSLGRIRTLKDERVFMPFPNVSGYLYFGSVMIHRAVAAAFLGPKPTKKHQVAHNNGIKADNRIENLRWATPKENAQDRYGHGTAYPSPFKVDHWDFLYPFSAWRHNGFEHYR